tara:strand:- start:77541 stop:78293 length:753 start_codon:yes stop_codon:yes gene_type:complete
MKKTANLLLILFSFVFLQSCDDEQFDASAFNYVAFGSSTYTAGVDVGGTTTVAIPVIASKVGAATITVSVDGSGAGANSYEVPASLSIPAGSNEGTLSVTLSDSNLGIGVNSVVITFGDDLASGISSGTSTTISYTQNCAEVTGTLDLTFDRWGSEVSWEIQDSLGGTVTSGGGYGNTGAGTSTSDSIAITLCQGRSYTLITTDAYGDTWGAVGNYTLTVGGVVKVQGDSSLMNNGGTGSISSTAAFNTL